MSRTDELERLVRLRDQGILTEEEFLAEKRRVLQHDEGESRESGFEQATMATGSIDSHDSVTQDFPANVSPSKVGAAWKIVRNLTLLALILGGSFYAIIFIMARFKGARPMDDLRQTFVLRPEPVVVDQSINDSESTIWDASCTVVGSVRNKGADGYVLIKGVVEQGGKYFERHERRYLNHEEECAVKYTFDEVTAGGGRITYHIEVYSAE